MKKNKLKLQGNALVGQSGGPTPVINATLAGVIKECGFSKEIECLYGLKNGIEGLFGERFIDLGKDFKNQDYLLLTQTPSSALGSCRYRLPNQNSNINTYEKIGEIFEKYNIRYFFYIGGNDSMDTVSKLFNYFKSTSFDVRIAGIPKTIDNDLVITDHTPGFGSSAKLIATAVKEIACDISCYTQRSVTIIELMGRDTGWLATSSALPKYYYGYGADLIYLPEIPFSKEKFIDDIKECFKKKTSVLVCVSEGIREENGKYVSQATTSITDGFNHAYFEGVGKVLESLVKENIGCKVRSIQLSLLQRCSSHILSRNDVHESIKIGKVTVRLAKKGHSGFMSAFYRDKDRYSVTVKPVSIDLVANKTKNVPMEFINKDGNNVTKECIDYLTPLVLGEKNIKYENGMPLHFRFE